MNDLRSRDPAAARALLDDLRGVRDARGEPALWEQWAKAAGNVSIHLQSRDPAAAQALRDELSALPPDFSEWALSRLNLFGDIRAVAEVRDDGDLWAALRAPDLQWPDDDQVGER